MNKQPEALFIAECIDPPQIFVSPAMRAEAAAELRRLHEANQALLKALKPFAVYGRIGSKDIEVGAAIAAIAKGEQA